MRAAVLYDYDRPLEIRDIQAPDPGPRDVRVRLRTSGVCGSDKSLLAARWAPLPIIPGHEAAGEVEAIGDEVQGIAVGDHVVLSAAWQCGECFFCRRGQRPLCETTKIAELTVARREGRPVESLPPEARVGYETPLLVDGEPVYRFFWSGTFSEVVFAPQQACTVIDRAVPLDVASLLGCAVMTGVGAALNGADITEGATVVVLGAGGVGLNAVQGARIAGAGRIIAADVNAHQFELARRLGATDTIDIGAGDPAEAVRELTGGYGADVVIEVVSASSAGSAGPDLARVLARIGGQIVLVGGGEMHLPANFIVEGKRITTVVMGNADLSRDLPRLARLYLEGELLLEELVTRRLPLEDVNEAFAAMARGEGGRSLLVF